MSVLEGLERLKETMAQVEKAADDRREATAHLISLLETQIKCLQEENDRLRRLL